VTPASVVADAVVFLAEQGTARGDTLVVRDAAGGELGAVGVSNFVRG
jgi:hypothetical protein